MAAHEVCEGSDFSSHHLAHQVRVGCLTDGLDPDLTRLLIPPCYTAATGRVLRDAPTHDGGTADSPSKNTVEGPERPSTESRVPQW